MQDDGRIRRRDDDGDDAPRCHCQGGRLLVLFGPVRYKEGLKGPITETATGNHFPEDQALFNAQNWALGLYQSQRNAGKHIHMLSYNANPSGAPNAVHQPSIPMQGATPAETMALQNGDHQDMPGWNWKWQPLARVAKIEDTLPKCCCFLTEVLLICHGGQGADVSFITETLAKVIGGRPVEKFVFWSCRSGKLAMPGDEAYERICGTFRPRMCECGCTAGACTAFDPDGRQRHCPDGTQSTTIITSGQFEGKLTPVGLSPSTDPPAANPFTTPDGQVRTITIAPDAKPPADDQATATIGPAGNPPPSASLFGGAGTSRVPPVPPPAHNPTDAAKLIARMQRVSKVRHKKTPYAGPEVNLAQCQPSEGCLPGGGTSAPP
jgi:hypothetical protein